MSDQFSQTTRRQQPVYQCPVTGIVPFRASCKCHKPFEDHWHSEIEIYYIMPESSSITVYIDGTPYPLFERDMLIVPSAAVHRIEVSEEKNRVLRLDIGYPLLGENFRPFTEKQFITPYYSLAKETSEHFRKLETIFHTISQEKLALSEENQENEDSRELDTIISRMHVSAYLIEVASILLENLPMDTPTPSERRKQHSFQALQSVVFYLKHHYNEPITLEEAAVMAGYEKTHFCQLFKKAIGKSFHQYLTQLRLEEALPLLRDTALPIASIAKSVGINNIKTFSRLTRQYYGMSPGEVRDNSCL